MNKTTLLVTLFVETGDEQIRTRQFRVSPNKRIPIGRASLRRLHDERPAPAKDNAFFDCPVVSRRHAFLSVDTGALILTDNNSRHGCFVNLHKLSPNESRELFCGDTVNIGGVDATPSRSYSSLQFTVSYSKMASELERIDSGISIASSPNSLNQSTTFVVPDSSDESGHSDHGVTEPDENDLVAVDAPSSTLSSKLKPSHAAKLRAAAEKVALRRKLRNYGIDNRSDRSQLAPHVISLIDEDEDDYEFDPEFEPDEEEVDEYEDFETALNAASATAVLSKCDDGKDIDQPNQHLSSPPDVLSTTRSLGTLEPPISLNVSHSDSKAPSSVFQPGKSTNKDANPSSSAHSNAAACIASPTADPEHIREIESDSLEVNSLFGPPMTYSRTLSNSNHLASPPYIHSLAYLPPPPLPGPLCYHPGFEVKEVAGTVRKGSDTMKINTLLNDTSGTDSAAGRKRKVDGDFEGRAFVSFQEGTIDNDAIDDSTNMFLSATASTPSHKESQAIFGQGAKLDHPASANILSDGHFQASDELTGDSGGQSSMTTQEVSSPRHATFQDAKATADTDEPRVKRVRRSCSPTPVPSQSSVPTTRRRTKRSKSKASVIAPFVMGAVVGGLGLFGALALLPESFF